MITANYILLLSVLAIGLIKPLKIQFYQNEISAS